ncbi:MAG: hypothetical protein ACRDNS_00630 [Trebonia sp.]
MPAGRFECLRDAEFDFVLCRSRELPELPELSELVWLVWLVWRQSDCRLGRLLKRGWILG